MIYMVKVPSVPHLIHSITINNIRSQRKPKRTLLKKKTSQNLCYLIMVSKQKISEKMSQLRQELFTLQHPAIDRSRTLQHPIIDRSGNCRISVKREEGSPAEFRNPPPPTLFNCFATKCYLPLYVNRKPSVRW